MAHPHQHPKVSVIIPAYNASPYIGETVSSVLNQTFSDLELIVIDHGSEDDTRSIVESLDDGRIKVFSIPQSGFPAIARNFGLDKAQCEYLAFLDADDCWHPQKIEASLHLMSERKGEFVFTNLHYIDDEGRLGPIGGPRHIGKRNVISIRDPLLLLWNMIPFSSVVISRSLLGPYRFEQGPEFSTSEDHPLWMYLNQTSQLHYLPEPLLYRRVHPGTASVSSRRRKRDIELFFNAIAAKGWYERELVELARKLGYLNLALRRGEVRGILHYLVKVGWATRKPTRSLILKWMRLRVGAGLFWKAKLHLLSLVKSPIGLRKLRKTGGIWP